MLTCTKKNPQLKIVPIENISVAKSNNEHLGIIFFTLPQIQFHDQMQKFR